MDVTRAVSEDPRSRKRSAIDLGVYEMATAFTPAASWTYKLDSEAKREHDFNNLLLELCCAVERQDSMLIEYCEGELKRMYRARGPGKGHR